MTRYKWINRWIITDLSSLHLVLAFSLCALYAGGLLVPERRLMAAGQWGLFVLILIHFIHMHEHACHEFLSVHLDTDRIPKAQMKQVNGIYLSLFMMITSVMMIILPAIWGKPFLSVMKHAIISFFRWIFSFFPKGGAGEETAALQPVQNMQPLFGPESYARSPAWMKLLDLLAGFVAAAVLCLFLGFIIYKIYQLICRLLTRKSCDDDEKQFLTPDFLTLPMEKEAYIPLWRDFTINGKVRRLYKKKIKKLSVRNRTPSFRTSTPSEIEDAAGLSKNRAAYHQLYEMARYGKEPIQKEELERLLSEERDGDAAGHARNGG